MLNGRRVYRNVVLLASLAATGCGDGAPPADDPAETDGNARDDDRDGDGNADSRDDGAWPGRDSREDDEPGTRGDATTSDETTQTPRTSAQALVQFLEGPPAGNAAGACPVPAEAGLEDSSNPDQVVGDGSPESCTAEAFIDAVALGGVITFDCGPDPIVIRLSEPAKVFNDASDDIVIDGGGKVTLSGGGTTRILYMNTCDQAQHWTSERCDDQATPRLTVQNLTFVDGNSTQEDEFDGGGAIWSRGGRLKIVNSRFFNNVCAATGPDVGGAGVRVFDQYQDAPVSVVNSTFGGADGYGNRCSNGGGISSIGVSWNIYNSHFSHNEAIGNGGNPAEDNTPGGGSGGAIYSDGGTLSLSVCGTLIEHNRVNAYGSAIFFVSNNHDGSLRVENSVIRDNSGGGWNVLPGISMHEDTEQVTIGSTIE